METRRAKRRRLADCDADGDAEPAADARRTYLGTLPADALHVVLRHHSTRPRHRRWLAYVTPYDMGAALSAAHPLRHAARAACTALHAHYGYVMARSRVAAGVQLDRVKRAHCDALGDLLNAQASRLRLLTMDLSYDYRFVSGASFAHLRALRVLVLGFGHHKVALGALLAACGASLRELHLTNEDHLPQAHAAAIAERCTSLETLTLDHGTTDVSLLPLWRAVGGRLKKLAVWPPRIEHSGSVSYAEELEQMGGCLAALVDLELSRTGKRLIAQPLLRVVGAQLQVLRFMHKDSCPPPEALAVALRLCPKAALHLHVERALPETLRLCGGRLRQVNCRHNFNSAKLDVTSETLSKVERCTVCCRPDGALAAAFCRRLFSMRMPALRKLILLRTFEARPASGAAVNLLDIVAPATGALQDVECTTTEVMYGVHVDALLKSNSELRRLWVTNKVKCGSSAAVKRLCRIGAASLVSRVVDSGVRELVVKDQYCKTMVKEVADACVRLRSIGRDVDVIVGAVRYLPTAMKLQCETMQY